MPIKSLLTILRTYVKMVTQGKYLNFTPILAVSESGDNERMVSLNDPSERALWNLSLILREISEGLCSHVSGQEHLYQSQIEKTHFSDQIRQDELAKLKEVAYEAVPDETKLREAFKIESYENRLAYREAISRRIEEAGITAYQQQAELEGILEFLNTDPVATYRGTMVVKPYISAKEIKRRIAAGEPVRKRPRVKPLTSQSI